MKVELLHATPLRIAIAAMRRCWRSEEKSDSRFVSGNFVIGENDEKLIRHIIKLGHTSTVEHVCFSFDVQGMSRALLQELARHRLASLSVESTRFTLNRLVRECGNPQDMLVATGVPEVDAYSLAQLESLIELSCRGDIPNDKLKYMLPEAYKTNLIWSINARSMMNFLTLRTSSKALWEMRELAANVHAAIPAEHKILFEHIMGACDGSSVQEDK